MSYDPTSIAKTIDVFATIRSPGIKPERLRRTKRNRTLK
jgi:hypothetical protein